jgi:hypothetical protein
MAPITYGCFPDRVVGKSSLSFITMHSWKNPNGFHPLKPALRRRRAEAVLWRAGKAEGTSYAG